MTSFLTITLFIVAAHGAVLPPKISEDVLVKGFPVFKLDLDRNEDVRMMTLPEIMKDAGIEISRQNKEENRDELPGLHFNLKNKIVARNVHEEDDDHQQHDDVPHKDHSLEKHDHEHDKREDCEED